MIRRGLKQQALFERLLFFRAGGGRNGARRQEAGRPERGKEGAEMHLVGRKCILLPEALKKPGKPLEWRCNLKKGSVNVMGLVLFALLSVSEIVLAFLGRGKEKSKKRWLKGRLFVRTAQLAAVLIALLLPGGQKWRLVPALGLLAVLLAVAAVKWLRGRGREDAEKKAGSVVASCVLSILFLTLSLLPAFVFTGYRGLPVSGQHPIAQASAILVDRSRTDPFEQDGSFREVPVHFYYPADAAAGERFPLVVFSHGAFGYYESNTSTYRELVSRGYVVAALDHPHHAFFTQDTAGKTVLVDRDFFQTASALNNSNSFLDPEARFPIFRSWMELRTADMNCVLDALQAAGGSGALDGAWFLPENNADTILSVLKMTDLTKIGLMGHSMGGATAVQVGRERSDVSAVVDLDGTMLGEELGAENGTYLINQEPYAVPVLEFANWEQYNDRREYPALGYLYPNDVLLSHAAESYYVTVRDTLHMDFTDLPLLSPTLGKLLGSGERGCEETMNVVNGLVREFFDYTLKGEGAFSVQEIY